MDTMDRLLREAESDPSSNAAFELWFEEQSLLPRDCKMAAAYAWKECRRRRLSSLEAAWETVEAFHRGVRLIGSEDIARFLGSDIPLSHNRLHSFATWPLEFCRNAGTIGRALFAECLRLGREGK